MPTTLYTVFDGEIVSESRNGVLRDYVSDPLGNTIALLDNTQTQTDQWAYFPYGESVRLKGTTATPVTYVGYKSCRQDSSASRSYMQQRYLDIAKARWLTEDPIGLGSGLNLYSYVSGQAVTRTDSVGMYEQDCYAEKVKCYKDVAHDFVGCAVDCVPSIFKKGAVKCLAACILADLIAEDPTGTIYRKCMKLCGLLGILLCFGCVGQCGDEMLIEKESCDNAYRFCCKNYPETCV